MVKEKSEENESKPEGKKLVGFINAANKKFNLNIGSKEKSQERNRVFFPYSGALAVDQKIDLSIFKNSEFKPWLEKNVGRYLVASQDGVVAVDQDSYLVSSFIHKNKKFSDEAREKVEKINTSLRMKGKPEIETAEMERAWPIGLIENRDGEIGINTKPVFPKKRSKN